MHPPRGTFYTAVPCSFQKLVNRLTEEGYKESRGSSIKYYSMPVRVDRKAECTYRANSEGYLDSIKSRSIRCFVTEIIAKSAPVSLNTIFKFDNILIIEH